MIATGSVGGFTALLVMRMLLGVGESVSYPATSRVLVENFPEHRRGAANALVDAGAKVGTALSILLGGLIIAEWGWRRMFLAVGLASLAWLVPWLALAPTSPERRPEEATGGPPGVPFGQLLAHREVWGTSLGFFCLGYAWYFLVTWLPGYLEDARGFSKEDMAVFGSIPFWAMAVTSVASGWIADAWIARGASPTLVRKTFLLLGFLLCAACLSMVAVVKSGAASVAMLTAACASLGLYSSNAWAVTQTLAGPLASGRWSGIKNAVGNLGGVASPALTGWIVKETGSYIWAFGVAAGVLFVGMFAYVLLIGRIAPLEWVEPEASDFREV
jgi:MFS family permease